MNRKVPLKDRLRIELVVRRVDYVLDGRVPMAKRRQIRTELRSNLIEAAQDVGGGAETLTVDVQVEALEDRAATEALRQSLDFDGGSHAGNPSVQRKSRASIARMMLSENFPHSASKAIAVMISSVREIC